MIRFLMVFVLVLFILFRIDMLNDVQHALVEPWSDSLALASAICMTWFDADVVHQGRVLMSRSSGFAVSIEAGCNGIEAAIVLTAGIFAFPSTWMQKALGFIAGFVAVQAVNLLRIISLYYLGQWDMAIFEFAHLYLWQALIMLDVLVVWLFWVGWVGRSASTVRASANAN